MDCTFEEFSGKRHEVARLTYTRADLCAEVAFLSQVTKKKFNWGSIKLTNKTVQRAKNISPWGLIQHDLQKTHYR